MDNGIFSLYSNIPNHFGFHPTPYLMDLGDASVLVHTARA
jgi:hypothetical protein